MISYSNIQRFENLPEADYRAASGYSFSFLKRQRDGEASFFEATPAMKLGTRVHKILSNEVSSIDYDGWEAERNMAITIKQTYFSACWNLLNFEVSYFAQANFEGFKMLTKGRTDCELFRRATLDFKITKAKTDAEFAKLISFMKYDDQIWHYGNLGQTPARYLLPYSVSRKCCLGLVRMNPEPRNAFWESKIKLFGTYE